MKKYLTVFTLDTRSLALLRIGMGLIVAYDFLLRLSDVTAHYSDVGMLPRASLSGMYSTGWPFSLSLLSGNPFFQVIVLLVGIVTALLFACGFHSKVANVATWILVISIQIRNPYLCHGGDTLLRLLLFWSIFVPMGHSWSLDAHKKKQPHTTICSPATAVLMLQIIAMYLFSGLWKTGPAWTETFTAIEYSLHYNSIALPFSKVIAQYPEILKVGTVLVRWYMLLMLPLLLIPWKNNLIRMLIVYCSILMHVSFGLIFSLDIFVYICIAAWFTFIPTGTWGAILGTEDVAQRGIKRSDTQRVFEWLSLTFFIIAIAFHTSYYAKSINELTHTFGDIHYEKYPHPFPDVLTHIVHILQLTQHWGMFAPHPPMNNVWYTVLSPEGKDILWPTGTPVRPFPFSAYVSHRWKTLLAQDPDQIQYVFPAMAQYLCDKQSITGEVVLMKHSQKVVLDQLQQPINSTALASHICQ